MGTQTLYHSSNTSSSLSCLCPDNYYGPHDVSSSTSVSSHAVYATASVGNLISFADAGGNTHLQSFVAVAIDTSGLLGRGVAYSSTTFYLRAEDDLG
eukprot:116553-Hanusia_phi.AAC.1